MIEIRGLAKNFGALHVLRDVDLHIARGRVTAIVGPNGAGKTTLIKCILGLTRAGAGSIRIDGRLIGSGDDYRSRVGYMPQIARFPDRLTARHLLTLLEDLRRSEPNAEEELVARFALAQHLAKPLCTLSGGTRQRFNAVLALLFRPEILILDEPTAGLDPVSSAVLKDTILLERAAGRTVVLSSHIMNELEELADDVVFLADGRVAYAGALPDLKRITRQANLERAVAAMMREEAAACA